METYHGHVRTPADAIILFEACRIGLLPRVQRRLSEKERQAITSGSVFVWDEREAGMRRWTDGKSWSASRVSGSFLTYREMEGKRGSNFPTGTSAAKRPNGKSPDGSATGDSDGEGPDGYRYKPDGLMKQSFSITTQSGQHLHLISYYSRSNPATGNLQQPTTDPQLRHIRPPKSMYPESSVNETAAVPAMTRTPMPTSTSPYPGTPQPPPVSSPPYQPHRSPAHMLYPYPPTPPYAIYAGNAYPFYPPPHGHMYIPMSIPPQGLGAIPHQPNGHAFFAQPHPSLLHHSMQTRVLQAPESHAPHPANVQQSSLRIPPPTSTLPEPGPQLPAISGSIAKPPSPQSSEAKSKDSGTAEFTESSAGTRNVPSINTLLNEPLKEPVENEQSSSRSGSRSPGNAQRPFPPLPTHTNSAVAASENAINKLNSTFR